MFSRERPTASPLTNNRVRYLHSSPHFNLFIPTNLNKLLEPARLVSLFSLRPDEL